ncbi:MAG: amino acid-binding protein, partial [Acidimicrobiales bacterium]
MVTYVVRVWIPDRPGALGAVASRIGAVRGDVVGIDILERGAGVAVDELVVMLPDDDLVALLISEIGQVDGVVVEDLRPAPGPLPDPRVAALESAELLVQQRTPAAVVGALADHAHADFEADWVAVIDPASSVLAASVGTPPPLAWLRAFAAGSRA